MNRELREIIDAPAFEALDELDGLGGVHGSALTDEDSADAEARKLRTRKYTRIDAIGRDRPRRAK